MKIISGKTIFASLVFFLIMSFVVNNFLNNDASFRDKDKYKRGSENQDKIIGVEIRHQNKQGDKFYIIAGDEWSNQFGMAGGFHFWDFTNPKKPVETAVFQVPEAGSHNHWVHGDTLLASNYQGGLRIVDISGELMGDIYSQGREIAFFKPIDNKGFKPNQTNVWGTMPYKGLIYFSDMYNGLWAVKLESETQMARN